MLEWKRDDIVRCAVLQLHTAIEDVLNSAIICHVLVVRPEKRLRFRVRVAYAGIHRGLPRERSCRRMTMIGSFEAFVLILQLHLTAAERANGVAYAVDSPVAAGTQLQFPGTKINVP